MEQKRTQLPRSEPFSDESEEALRARETMEQGEYTGLLPEYFPVNIGMEAADTSQYENVGMIRIINPTTQKGSNQQMTPNDPKLGVMNRFDECQTCGGDTETCTGHYGYIPLDPKAHHLNSFFVQHAVMILNSVCHVCTRLLIRQEDIKEHHLDQIVNKVERLKAIEKLSTGLLCTRNPEEKVAPKSIFNKRFIERLEQRRQEQCSKNRMIDLKSYHEKAILSFKESKETSPIPIETIKDIFARIPREDLRLLGFDDDNRGPSNYIQENILVLPPTIRKETLHENDKNSDKMVYIYNKIIEKNRALNNLTNSDLKQKKDIPLVREIKEQSAKLISTDKNMTFFERGTKEFPGIQSIFGGKEGLIRGNMGAKRTNFTARTVVAPGGTSVNANQIGLPYSFRSKLVPYEKVTRYNKAWLRKLILRREAEWVIVGEPKIYQKNGEQSIIPVGVPLGIHAHNYQEIANSLAYGDIVARYLMNGDYVLINRNPTIQKEGIMAAEVRLLPNEENVIRLFLPLTGPFNADHDGDEMNIHLAQGVLAEAEMRNLMNVSNCMVSSQSNRNAITLTYTAPHSLNDLLKQTQINEYEFQNHGMLAIELFPKKFNEYNNFKDRLRYFNVPLKSGRAVFSFPLPRGFSYQNVVKNGVYLPTKITGPQANNLIHQAIMHLDKEVGYTTDDAKEYGLRMISYYQQYIDRASSLVRSVGYRDCFVDDKRIKTLSRAAVNMARGKIAQLNLATSDPLEKELNLQRIIVTLSNTKSIGTKISKEILDDRNNLVSFLETKSKGHTSNLVQMISGVFDIFVRGSIQKKNFFGNRPGPHFSFNDESLEAMGFAEQSYSRGLPFEQIFFTISGALEGLVDSSTKTADTGDLARHLNVILTGYKTEWNRMGMGANGEILQYFAGGDGFDPRKLSSETIRGKSTPFPVNVKNIANNLKQRGHRVSDKNRAIRDRILKYKK